MTNKTMINHINDILKADLHVIHIGTANGGPSKVVQTHLGENEVSLVAEMLLQTQAAAKKCGNRLVKVVIHPEPAPNARNEQPDIPNPANGKRIVAFIFAKPII
jgi:hypothetical protein